MLSKDRTPGGNHPFAEIRLALSRGNHNLKCDDKEIGNNYLECGLYVYSPDGQLENVTFSKYINEKWSYRYHNFTVVWDRSAFPKFFIIIINQNNDNDYDDINDYVNKSNA